MLYTAYNVNTAPRVALTKISVKDFIANNWDKWSKPILISPPGISDKDACFFLKRLMANIMFYRLENEIDLCAIDDLEFKGKNRYLEENNWLAPRKGWWDHIKVGAAAPN